MIFKVLSIFKILLFYDSTPMNWRKNLVKASKMKHDFNHCILN